MAPPSSSGETTLLGPIDRASLYRWTMDKVQRTDRSNIAPPSKHLKMNYCKVFKYIYDQPSYNISQS
jgi:hypothetical protein